MARAVRETQEGSTAGSHASSSWGDLLSGHVLQLGMGLSPASSVECEGQACSGEPVSLVACDKEDSVCKRPHA